MKVTLGNYPKKSGERKVEIRIDKWDSWNADTTIALIVVPLLKQLLATTHGTPNLDWQDTKYTEEEWDVINSFTMEESDTEEENEARSTAMFEAWKYIMNEMIFALESCYNDWDSKYFVHPEEDTSKPLTKESFLEHARNIKFDEEGYNAENKRIENGLRLFGKYFRGLWD